MANGRTPAVDLRMGCHLAEAPACTWCGSRGYGPVLETLAGAAAAAGQAVVVEIVDMW